LSPTDNNTPFNVDQANLAYWYTPATIIPSGTGVNAATVPRWADQSRLNQDLIQVVAVRQPIYIPPAQSAIRGFAGIETGPASAARWLQAVTNDPTGAALNTDSFSFYALLGPLEDGVLGNRTIIGFSNLAQFDDFEGVPPPATASNNQTITMEMPFPDVHQANFGSFSGLPILLEFIGAAIGQPTHLYANGVLVATGTAASSAFTALVLGSIDPPNPAFSKGARFWEVMAYAANHTAGKRQMIEAYFANKYGAQIIFDGNSQFFGGSASGGGMTIPGHTPVFLPFFSMYVNNGQNGITTPQLVTRMAATTLPLVNNLVNKTVMCFLEMENDISGNGASANPNDLSYVPTAVQNVLNWSRAARLGGVKTLILGTCLPIGPLIPPPANYENSRQAANAQLRLLANTIDPTTGLRYFDGTADIGSSTSGIGNVSDTLDPTKYNPLDEQHLNDGGGTIASQLYAAAILSALA
jgi:hypothetical protein